MMSCSVDERVLLLQEEVRSLSQELAQCQADKEFVWSLWKRLQAANPDLTQAVSLVLEREKQKGETKDRKVLEILQAKDYKIQELEQEAKTQRQEVSGLLQQQRLNEEERHGMKKELTELQQTLSDTTRRQQECDDGWMRRLDEQQEKCRTQEETRLKECDDGWRRRLEQQQEQSRKQEETYNKRLREVQEELVKSQTINSSLSLQLNSLQQKLTETEQQLQQLRGKLQDLQSLYVQSVSHAGEQAELIQQLEGLNMDTQQILQSQEKVHTTHTASYHKLYSELSVSYQALCLSAEQLRQRDTCLTEQLHQKEQQVSDLQDQLQQLIAHHPQSPEQRMQQECVVAAESKECVSHSPSSQSQSCGTQTVQFFRSVSPCRKSAEQKIQQLEELLTLKTAENQELKRAHAKRHDRLRLIQTNYRAVKEQLKETEDTHTRLPDSSPRRAELRELRQENSDAVWNELSFFKRENKKLLTDRSQLEEELDVARVRVAMERATAQELRLRLHEQQQVLQLDDDDDDDDDEDRVSSTPPPPPVHRVQLTVRKVKALERKMVCMQKEILQLREDRRTLQDSNGLLLGELEEARAALQQARVREDVSQGRVSAERDRLLGEAQALQAQLEKSRRTETASQAALLRVRQEVGVVRAERDYYRNRIQRGHRTHTNARRTVSLQTNTHSPARDEWEDISPETDGEEFLDSLVGRRSPRPLAVGPQWKACAAPPPHQHAAKHSSTAARTRITVSQRDVTVSKKRMIKGRRVCVGIKGAGVCEDAAVRKRRVMKRRCVCAVYNHRVMCLQQQVAVLQAASRAAHQERIQSQHTHTQLQTLIHTLQLQKTSLEAELEQLRKSRPPETQQPSVTVTPPEELQNIKTLETEIKHLSSRLKSSSAELSRQSASIKSLKTELHDRDQRLKELQDKVSHGERDVVMKRQLVEDLRSRLKVLQDSESSHRSHIDELERKVKSQCEEASNRKCFIESLKTRLNVATHHKQQCESSSNTLREQLHTKEQKLTTLQARLAECERSKVELEQTATKQMQLLTNQSTETIHTMQKKLTQTHTQHQHLCSVIQTLAMEVDREVRERRAELRKRRRERKRKERSEGGGVSQLSMVKAQSIAASILNVSANDLHSILNPEQEGEDDEEAEGVWMDHIQQLLDQQCFSAGELLGVFLVKMKENRALMEELVTLRER